jgi:hypothetical protein
LWFHLSKIQTGSKVDELGQCRRGRRMILNHLPNRLDQLGSVNAGRAVIEVQQRAGSCPVLSFLRNGSRLLDILLQRIENRLVVFSDRHASLRIGR